MQKAIGGSRLLEIWVFPRPEHSWQVTQPVDKVGLINAFLQFPCIRKSS